MAISSKDHTKMVLIAASVGTFAVLMTLEALSDLKHLSATSLIFEALETVLNIAVAFGILGLIQRIGFKTAENQALLRELQAANSEGRKWQDKVRDHLHGLRSAMDDQFDSWGLTSAEKEVGLLILRGVSHKGIARVRETNAATVRQQAQSIYKKAGLSGKAAVLSFFLGDLFTAQYDSDASSRWSFGEKAALGTLHKPRIEHLSD